MRHKLRKETRKNIEMERKRRKMWMLHSDREAVDLFSFLGNEMEIHELTLFQNPDKLTGVQVKFQLSAHDWDELRKSDLWQSLEDYISQKEYARMSRKEDVGASIIAGLKEGLEREPYPCKFNFYEKICNLNNED